MDFYKTLKKENNPDGNRYAVYMRIGQAEHYVSDFIDSNSAEDVITNELGLTLRSRLNRSKGKYAMLEGTIFNPERLLNIVCAITDYKKEVFTGGDYKKGYTLLTVIADGCVNKYMIFDKSLLESLLGKILAR